MHLVVCYDIVSDRRRARLFKRLKGFLVPVQKSVFEGELPERRYPELLDVVRGLLDPSCDTVRVYHLCGGCCRLTELLGVSVFVPDPDEDTLV